MCQITKTFANKITQECLPINQFSTLWSSFYVNKYECFPTQNPLKHHEDRDAHISRCWRCCDKQKNLLMLRPLYSTHFYYCGVINSSFFVLPRAFPHKTCKNSHKTIEACAWSLNGLHIKMINIERIDFILWVKDGKVLLKQEQFLRDAVMTMSLRETAVVMSKQIYKLN